MSSSLATIAVGSSRSRRLAALLATGAVVAGALTATAPPVSAATSTETAAAASVFALLNSERAAHHLPALGWSTALVSSARRHNVAMAQANTMSHQLPGEAVFSTRISQAGVPWHSVAENIGWTTNRTSTGANGLETAMYDEKAPDDGHRQNILSTSTRYVGIDTLIDAATGKLWLTQDFTDVAGPSSAGPATLSVANHNPGGHYDTAIGVSGHRVKVTGWAVDPDRRSQPLMIAVYYDGRYAGRYHSTITRSDVAASRHTGPMQGFSILVRLPLGKHSVCTYPLNILAGNANPRLGCKVVTIS